MTLAQREEVHEGRADYGERLCHRAPLTAGINTGAIELEKEEDMRYITALLTFVLGMLLASPPPGHAEQGRFQVLVDGVTHTIDYQAVIEQAANDLRDPARSRFLDGSFLFLEVFDGTEPRIVRGVTVKRSPTPGFPDGAEYELPMSFNDPGDTGVDFAGLVSIGDADLATFEFIVKVRSRGKEKDTIRVAPFPITVKRVADLQNVQILDDTTKPVIQWSSIPGVQNYRVKIFDLGTPGPPVFVTRTFGAVFGDVQTLDLKAPPTGGFPDPWTGMDVGKRYAIRIEGRHFGPNPVVSHFITLPATGPVPAPVPGQGRLTRARRFVEYTPLVSVFP